MEISTSPGGIDNVVFNLKFFSESIKVMENLDGLKRIFWLIYFRSKNASTDGGELKKN